ncbi:MAG: hypothetical protein ACI9HK_006095 [Pirellulaceae bacterium]|jgi:hypothetical protein
MFGIPRLADVGVTGSLCTPAEVLSVVVFSSATRELLEQPIMNSEVRAAIVASRLKFIGVPFSFYLPIILSWQVIRFDVRVVLLVELFY